MPATRSFIRNLVVTATDHASMLSDGLRQREGHYTNQRWGVS
jgi:hypothetical protein